MKGINCQVTAAVARGAIVGLCYDVHRVPPKNLDVQRQIIPFYNLPVHHPIHPDHPNHPSSLYKDDRDDR